MKKLLLVMLVDLLLSILAVQEAIQTPAVPAGVSRPSRR
jgi:hypothetical protein